MSLELFLLLMILIIAVTVLLPDHPMTDWELGETDPPERDARRAVDAAGRSDDQFDGDATASAP